MATDPDRIDQRTMDRDAPAADSARTAEALARNLTENGCRYDFLQAVWLIERFFPGDAPIGMRGPVGLEPIRLRPDVSMGFPAADVRRIRRRRSESGDRDVFTIDCTFMGLYGVATPLPLHYAVDVLRAVESPSDDQTASDAPGVKGDGGDRSPVRDFLDVFHHRLLSLFYRAWTKYRYDVSFVLPDRDCLTPFLQLLVGCGEGWQRAQVGVEPIRLIRYAGLLTQHPVSAAAIEGILNDFWSDVEVRVAQFVGRWVALAKDDLNVLGRTNSRLGDDLILGEQMFDRSGSFDIIIGPMDWATYCSFLPSADRFAETVSLTRYACWDPLAFRMTLRIADRQVPPARLTSDDSAARLGYTSWLRTAEVGPTQVCFDAMN